MSNEGPGFTPHPSDPQMDLINTSKGPMYRRDFEQMMSEKDATPKSAVGKAAQLKQMLAQGKLTEKQYQAQLANLFSATGIDPETGAPRVDYDYTPASQDVEEQRAIEEAVQRENEVRAAHDAYFDVKDSVEELMLQGKGINKQSLRRLEDSIINAQFTAKKNGIDFGAEYWDAMIEDMNELKYRIRMSNAGLGHKAK